MDDFSREGGSAPTYPSHQGAVPGAGPQLTAQEGGGRGVAEEREDSNSYDEGYLWRCWSGSNDGELLEERRGYSRATPADPASAAQILVLNVHKIIELSRIM